MPLLSKTLWTDSLDARHVCCACSLVACLHNREPDCLIGGNHILANRPFVPLSFSGVVVLAGHVMASWGPPLGWTCHSAMVDSRVQPSGTLALLPFSKTYFRNSPWRIGPNGSRFRFLNPAPSRRQQCLFWHALQADFPVRGGPTPNAACRNPRSSTRTNRPSECG